MASYTATTISKGDRIEIRCQGHVLTGTVIRAENNWDFGKYNWYIEYEHDRNGYAYWKQAYDGGTVIKI